jgi:C-terminal processing protease CtpA/Prc
MGCLISLTLFLAVSRIEAQPLAFYKVREIKKAFTIAGDGTQETAFFFPHAEEFGPLNKGYAIKAPGQIVLSGKTDGVPTPETVLFVRLYTRNISKVRFSVPGGEEKKPIEIPVAKDGYQLPAFLRAEKLLPLPGDPAALKISYSLSDSSRPFTLVIGDLWIGEEHIADRLSPSDIFVHAPFANAVRQTAWQWSPFDSYGECAYFPVDQKEENFKGSIFIHDSSQTSNQLLSGILLPLLDHYPFYAARGVRKDSLRQSAAAFLRRHQNLPLCPFIDSINTFLRTSLHDPHFSIRGACDNRKALRTPLYAYYLKGRYRIAGIFDDSLKTRVSLGTELLAVDGKLLDTARTGARDINGLLRKLPGEKVNITVRHPDGRVEDLAWQVKDKYKIPATFSPGNLDMKFIGDSICYYRIGKINMELPLDFASRLDSINTRKKLILDLRGNGGGDFLAGAQFLSYLIGRSYHYFDYEDVRTGKIDSVIIKANQTPFHYRPDGRIILLVDESTACIAELLVHTLRARRNNVVVVGRESTRGALAFIYEINLPKDNVVIATNCLDTGRFLLDGRSIEEKGISPDLRVVIEQIDDLQPYRDKVLSTAISK